MVTEIKEIIIISNWGGMGDNINRMPALIHNYHKAPHMTQKVVVFDYLKELFQVALAPYLDRIKIYSYTEAKNMDMSGAVIDFTPHVLTGARAHLTEVGFVYLCDFVPVRGNDWNLPQPDLTSIDVSEYNLPRAFGVLCTDYTAPARVWPTDEVEEVASWMSRNNITPVLLGLKNPELGNGVELPNFQQDLKTPVLDLRGKTSLPQALKILSLAKFAVGVDNGLLHLASMTDIPTIWGFTSVDPLYRLPFRHGSQEYKTLTIVPPESVECRFCQTHKRFVAHDFKQCYCKDQACVKSMTAGKFIGAIRQVIGDKSCGVRMTRYDDFKNLRKMELK